MERGQLRSLCWDLGIPGDFDIRTRRNDATRRILLDFEPYEPERYFAPRFWTT